MNDEKFCKRCDEQLIDKIPACPLQCSSPKCKAYQRKRKIDFSKKPIVWIMGGPGSGKGVQCGKIAAKFGFTHISVGDLLRDEIKTGGDRTKCLESVMTRGDLAPTDLVLSLVLKTMKKRAAQAAGILIDGYPRELRQGIAFEDAIGQANMIMYFDASPETLLARMMTRAQTSQRLDDNEVSIKCRIKTFFDNSAKVLELYPHRLIKINAEGIPEQVFNEVQPFIEELVKRPEFR